MDGRRPVVPPRDMLPGPDNTAFAGLDRYVSLMQSCWHQEPERRPGFASIIPVLEALLIEQGGTVGGSGEEEEPDRAPAVAAAAPAQPPPVEDESKCVLCIDAKPTVQLVHAGTSHKCLCRDCAKEAEKKRALKLCLICKQKVEAVVYDTYT
jgi:hypothetical protein